MKILSTSQIREADAATIANEPVSSFDLMERAAGKCVEWLVNNYGEKISYLIFCGNGNNGGDGLAMARLFFRRGIDVKVFILKISAKESDDFLKNLERVKKKGISVTEISDASQINISENGNDILIDAIFGSGLSREPEGFVAEVIDKLNSIHLPKISIDIPSGLFGDDNSKNSYAHVIRANATLVFQQPKLSFFFEENSPFVGDFQVLDIGLDQKYISEAKTNYFFTTHIDAKEYFVPRKKFSHKGTFGHALIVAGSKGKIGAAILSAKGCLHSGVGLLTVAVPKCGNDILQIAVPEAMVNENKGEENISGEINCKANQKSNFDCIGIGPGIGREKETADALKLLLGNYDGPLVLDADALNILSENSSWLKLLPKETILTPHPGEFDRLTKKHAGGFERMISQKEMAKKFGIYIVLKGAYTSVACPDGKLFFNSSGNPGMATGGSGDVLTGIITSLRAQKHDAKSACILGVYVHGLAGDIAAAVHSESAMTASDLIDNIGGAWRMLEER